MPYPPCMLSCSRWLGGEVACFEDSDDMLTCEEPVWFSEASIYECRLYERVFIDYRKHEFKESSLPFSVHDIADILGLPCMAVGLESGSCIPPHWSCITAEPTAAYTCIRYLAVTIVDGMHLIDAGMVFNIYYRDYEFVDLAKGGCGR